MSRVPALHPAVARVTARNVEGSSASDLQPACAA